MARRFKRENFLFPLDLRAPSGDVAAKPVDAFERASEGTVEQAPGRPFEVPRPSQNSRLADLGRSLGIAAESAQAISNKQYSDYTERAEAAGIALASEDRERGNKQSFKQLISRTRIDSGGNAAREIMGLSPHLKKAFDQTVARSAALDYNAALQAAYSSNPVVSEAQGLRLHDVEVSDPLYQQWVAGFTGQFEEENGVATLDPRARAALVPAIQDTQNRVTLAQDELRSERRLRQFEDTTTEFVNNTLFTLNGNAEWMSGNDTEAMQLAANLITQQIDEANALGYGGEDLDNIYAQIVENTIAIASTTGNSKLLDVLQLVEVGRPEDRDLLLDKASGGKFRTAVLNAGALIADRQFQQGQRDRQLRDQGREDAMNDAFEQVSLMAGLYQTSGKSPQAREALDNVIEAKRIEAAKYGFTVEFNSAIQRVLQEGVDNQGTPIIDYAAMSSLENDIIQGRVGGEVAMGRIRDMLMAGQFGNGQQAADNMLRLTSKVKANDDQALAQFGSEVDEAAAAYGQAYRQRMGYSEDEYGKVKSIRDTLISEGFNDQSMVTLMAMSPAALQAEISRNAEAAAAGEEIPYSQAKIGAMNQVVNGGLDPLNLPEPPDPGEIARQEIEFKNQMYRDEAAFREREGRSMTPQERGEYIRNQTAAMLVGQRAALPASNPLSSTGSAATGFQSYQNQLYNMSLDGVSGASGNPRTATVLDRAQVIKGLEHYMVTGNWHPEIAELARNNNMSPMELIQTQSGMHGAVIDPDLAISIGLPQAPVASAEFTSVYSRTNVDTAKGYSPGIYTTSKAYWIDDSPPGSYDFTFLQNGRDDINVPSPGDGVVSKVGNNAGGYGNWIEIKTRDGHTWFFAHLESVYFNPGDRVVKGQAFGKQGSTGNSSGPHLHVELSDRNGDTITNRGYTEPMLRDYVAFVEGGSFMRTPVPGSSTDRSVASMRPDNIVGGSGGPAASNRTKYLNGLAFLESTFNYEGSLSSGGASGYFQAMPIFRSELRRLGINDTSQSRDMRTAAQPIWQFIEKRYPSAVRAIDAGNWDEANRILKDTWVSLPGGSQATQTSDRYRTFQGFLNGSQAPRFTF